MWWATAISAQMSNVYQDENTHSRKTGNAANPPPTTPAFDTPIWRFAYAQNTTGSASAATAPPTAADPNGMRARTADQ